MIRGLTLATLILAAQSLSAGDLPQTAADVSRRYLHVREATNRNDGAEVEKFLRYLGLPKGQPWCAAFSLYCYKEAAEELNVRQPYPRYGRVAMLWSTCRSNPLKYRAITTEEAILGSVKLRPGDLPIWASGTIRSGDFNGHIGLIQQQISPKKIRTIEGNTTPGETGDQRDGGGVYERTRAISPGNFRIIGFCRLRGGA